MVLYGRSRRAGLVSEVRGPSRKRYVTMSDPNPYEPPQTPEPLTTEKVVKRGLGVVAILLLTPLAVAIAGGISCAAGMAFLGSTGKETDATVGTACAISFIPPALVLIGMLWWAVKRGAFQSARPKS